MELGNADVSSGVMFKPSLVTIRLIGSYVISGDGHWWTDMMTPEASSFLQT
jgi:hypothetical protein